MKIVLEVTEGPMVAIDGGPPMQFDEALMEIERMITGLESMSEQEMWDEEASSGRNAQAEMDESELEMKGAY